LRSLVKLAVASDSAEQLGRQLNRRYDRTQRRQGIAWPGRHRADHLIGKPYGGRAAS
jgi:hypothetical protein